MNIQELIEQYKEYENALYDIGAKLACQSFLKDLEKLDESQRVTIPQMVADWIKKCKTFKSFAVSLSFALQPSVWEANGLSGECIEWLMDAENQELFARAWLDGYEVEKEKRYRVRLKGLDKDLEYLNLKHGHVWVFSDNIENEEYRTCYTRKELEKAGFGEVFNSSLFEIEEVDD